MKILPVTIVIPALPESGRVIKLLTILVHQAKRYKLRPQEVSVVLDGGSSTQSGHTFQNITWPHWINFVATGERKGPASARNQGALHATTEWILFLDDDVIPAPYYIRELESVLDNITTQVGVIEGNVTLLEPYRYGPLTVGPRNESGGVFLTANLLVKKKVFLQAGGFDETFPYPAYEDVDFASRVRGFGDSTFAPRLKVYHEPRAFTFQRVLFEARTWKLVLRTARLYGFTGWPQYPTSRPLASTIYYGVLALPGGRILKSLRLYSTHPFACIKMVSLSLFSAFLNMYNIFSSALVFNKKKSASVHPHESKSSNSDCGRVE